jgi:catechol-2,3-dioxygenase
VPVTGLSHYNLRGSRELLERLRTFYCEVVGLSVGTRPPFTSHGYWLYAGEAALLHLSQAREGEIRLPDIRTTFDHVAFTCADRPGFEERLRQHGIRYTLAQVPQTGQTQLFFEDPAGNGVELNFDGA